MESIENVNKQVDLMRDSLGIDDVLSRGEIKEDDWTRDEIEWLKEHELFPLPDVPKLEGVVSDRWARQTIENYVNEVHDKRFSIARQEVRDRRES